MTMKTLNEEAEYYIQRCYPKGISQVQHNEVHQAFFAGALILLGQFEALTRVEDETYVSNRLNAIEKEIMDTLSKRAYELHTKNQ